MTGHGARREAGVIALQRGGFAVHHGPGTEHAVLSPDGFALAGWCECGLAFASRGRTVKKARRALWRKARDHRGLAAAAGPGWHPENGGTT